jgi:hypothetical protein
VSEGKDELELGLARLEDLARTQGAPNRHDVRIVLVSLGERILDRGMEDEGPTIDRARRVIAQIEAQWLAAVRDELSLACAEHACSADPRYVSLPNYDWDYALAARARLEARLVAARALGFEIPPGVTEIIARADRALEPHRRGRRP